MDKERSSAPQDPLDLAVELLHGALTGLQATIGDFKKIEATKLTLEVAKTTALIDMAKSMRVLNEQSEERHAELTEKLERIYRELYKKS